MTPLAEDAVWQARVDLAAALRWAARLGLSEGVCNHFSLVVPGADDRFLLNPQGLHWSEITASQLVVVDAEGTVIEGGHTAERSAFYIHSRIHLGQPAAKCVLHTHMAHATALCLVEGGRLEWANQNALRFYDRIAYDDRYGGVALAAAEGDRMCAVLADNTILFLANHGVIVTGADVATAFDDLYYLERACQQQILAQATGLPLKIIPKEIRDDVRQQVAASGREQAYLHFAALKRILDREEPEYAS